MAVSLKQQLRAAIARKRKAPSRTKKAKKKVAKTMTRKAPARRKRYMVIEL